MPLACAECTDVFDVKEILRCSKCKSLMCKPCKQRHKCYPMRNARITDFNSEKDTSTWLVSDLLPDTGWTLLHAPAGAGKTTFALQLCDALESGSVFLGRDTVKTRILYIQADSTANEFREITKRVIPHSKGWTMVNVPNQCLSNPGYTLALQELTAKVKAKFVVFDSLYNLSSGNINTDKILVDINMLKQIVGVETPWLMIHHQPHDQSRAAGHNSLEGNCSNNWCLLQNKLRIDKGRLVKEKQVLLDRDGNGLWVEHKADGGSDLNNMLNRSLL